MKRIFIDIKAIIVTDDLSFQKDVIHNLFRINKQLGYDLIFIISNKIKEQPSIAKALEILSNEHIVFEVISSAKENENTASFAITKNDTGFTVAVNNTASAFNNWNEIVTFLRSSLRKVHHTRNTNETKIELELNVDGNGVYNISTGLNFFNHMLEQFSKHSSC